MSKSAPVLIRRAESADREAVLAIHKERKSTLGHLPHAPFDSAIDLGWVLVAEQQTVIVGYLLYGVRKRTNDVRVDHLAVTASAAGTGCARALVETLLDEVSDLRRIVLKCRQDYEAHEFWKRCGFEAVGEVVGRSRVGTLLTKFERRLHSERTLFDHMYEHSTPFAVDLNVLLDLVLYRQQETAEIFQQLDQFDVHPIRTSTLLNELLGYPDLAVRDRARSVASLWGAPTELDSPGRLEQLQGLIPVAEKEDLEHLAAAEAASADVLLSRDGDFIEAVAASGQSTTSVEVLHPAQYLDRLFRDDAPDYLPAAVRGLAVEPASRFTQGRLADAFVASSHGETKAAFRAILSHGLADRSVDAGCLTQHGQPVCLYLIRETENGGEIELLRCVRGPHRATVLRQALAHLRSHIASESRVASIQIADRTLIRKDQHALLAEGFVSSEVGWAAMAIRGVHSLSSVERLLTAGPAEIGENFDLLGRAIGDAATSAEAHALVEALLDPLLIDRGSMQAVLVPIQAGWSDRLIGLTKSQLSFEIEGSPILQLREHVYFRSPRGLGMSAPLRVFWYRTAEGVSQVFATSTIEQVVVRALPEIWRRFGGYGVLQEPEIADRSDEDGRVMALKFGRTRRLARGVSLAELRAVADDLGATPPSVPVGPLRLDQRLQSWLLSSEVGPE